VALALVLTGLCAGTAGAETLHPKVKVSINCDSATYTYAGFPNANNNTVTEAVRVDGVLVTRQTFTFNGPTATNTVFFTPISGTHEVFARVEYHTNGLNGEYDRAKVILTCEPRYTIEKLQMVEGSGKPFTSSPLTGTTGQTVDYQIVVTNTGNAPLTFSEFTDPNCTNIAGGPGATPVAIGASTTYTCEHVLNRGGEYTNAATVTGTPEGGTPITHTSNTVVVNVAVDPAYTIEKLQRIKNGVEPFTTSPMTAGLKETMEYEIIVKNTGNVPLTFSEFTDEKCTNIAGGPGATPVAPGDSTTYTCEHLLSAVGKYTNTATVAGTPEGGTPITHNSNTVVVTVKRLAPTLRTKITCESVTFTFSSFPNENNNTVTEAIRVDGVLVYRQPFTFNGSSATNTVNFGPVGPGTHEIFARAEWHTNGFNGENDLGHVVLNCDKPAFTIEKLQQIEGSGNPFTSSELDGELGQTVDYQIIVKNTGNVPLTFSEFTDEKCTNIAGGPGATPVAPGESTTYTCEHLLASFGEYTNAATDTGTATGDPPVTHASNTVIVNVPEGA
jgi:hypothetical protein